MCCTWFVCVCVCVCVCACLPARRPCRRRCVKFRLACTTRRFPASCSCRDCSRVTSRASWRTPASSAHYRRSCSPHSPAVRPDIIYCRIGGEIKDQRHKNNRDMNGLEYRTRRSNVCVCVCVCFVFWLLQSPMQGQLIYRQKIVEFKAIRVIVNDALLHCYMG